MVFESVAILPYLRLGHVPGLYAAAYMNSGDLQERTWWLEQRYFAEDDDLLLIGLKNASFRHLGLNRLLMLPCTALLGPLEGRTHHRS